MADKLPKLAPETHLHLAMEIGLFNGIDILTVRERSMQTRLEERVKKRRNEWLIIRQVRRYPPAFDWEFVARRRQLWRRSNTPDDRAKLRSLMGAFVSDRLHGRGTSLNRLRDTIRDWRIFHAVAGWHLVCGWPLKRCWAEAAERTRLSREAVRKIWQVWQRRCRTFRWQHSAALDTKRRYQRLLRPLDLMRAEKWETIYRWNDLFTPGLNGARLESVSADAGRRSRQSLTECIRYFMRRLKARIKESERPLAFDPDMTLYLGWCRWQLQTIRFRATVHRLQGLSRDAENKGEPLMADALGLADLEMTGLVSDF